MLFLFMLCYYLITNILVQSKVLDVQHFKFINQKAIEHSECIFLLHGLNNADIKAVGKESRGIGIITITDDIDATSITKLTVMLGIKTKCVVVIENSETIGERFISFFDEILAKTTFKTIYTFSNPAIVPKNLPISEDIFFVSKAVDSTGTVKLLKCNQSKNCIISFQTS